MLEGGGGMKKYLTPFFDPATIDEENIKIQINMNMIFGDDLENSNDPEII
jgi:hypothetical protein